MAGVLKRVVIIYDDNVEAGKSVKNITGTKTFGNTIFKRKTLKRRMIDSLMENNFIKSVVEYEKGEDIQSLIRDVSKEEVECAVVHINSNFGIRNNEEFKILLEKAQFINKNMLIKDKEETVAAMFKSVEEYIGFLKRIELKNENIDFSLVKDFDIIESDVFVDLKNVNNFLQFITGGFDARFFNALEGDEYTVTKRSTNKKKIKMEYEFYYLLPDNMKMWFVMPFDYKENEESASYTMERYHMTDIAIRWIHGAISVDECDDILKKLFHFVKNRNTKAVSKEEYKKIAKNLYITKLEERIEDLKKSEYYVKFNNFISSGTEFKSIDEIVDKYKRLYDIVTSKAEFQHTLAVGHGDLCFSNILYNRETSMLKLIDPKGALKEEEIWTNPYYDIAKLSHSICGRYDFFNSALFDIKIEADMKLKLILEFDNTPYIELFKKYLKENGFDYKLVRLYEASLFLSMLPLHMDNPQKVFGFLLNAVNILDEVEKCIQD